MRRRQQQTDRRRDNNVTLAFHYTDGKGLGSIARHGLLTKADREGGNISSKFHGAVFGDGVYVANNPYSFAHYGDTCLLCAVMRGTEERVSMAKKRTDDGPDTIVGNKQWAGWTKQAPAPGAGAGGSQPQAPAPGAGAGGSSQPQVDQHAFDEIVLQESSQIIPICVVPPVVRQDKPALERVTSALTAVVAELIHGAS